MSKPDLPWRPESPQDKGRRFEKQAAKAEGVRLHPMSGAGSIKADGSTEDEVVEYKSTGKKSYTVVAKTLGDLHDLAVRQGKVARFTIEFQSDKLIADITIRRI